MTLDAFFNIPEKDVCVPEEIKFLISLDDLYYNKGKSPISDEEYDKLKENAKNKHPYHPYFLAVGSSVPGSKVKLPFILGSLNKIKIDDIENFFSNHKGEYMAMEKLDGVSIYAHYNRGRIIFAATRGDGYEGKDITDKARIFCPNIPDLSSMVLRGEAMLMDNIHKTLGYKTRRNGVAGILNKDDIKHCKHIAVIFYEVIEGGPKCIQDKNEVEKLIGIQALNLNIPNFKIIKEGTPNELSSILILFKEQALKNNYEIDGLVLKPIVYKRENIYYPKEVVAFKMNDLPIATKVLDVEWNVSRTGRVKPIVLIEPIKIGGVIVSKATGFNAEFIKEKSIGKDSEIEIIRSGDVIPHITGILKSTKTNIIEYCPSCEYKLQWEGVDLVCKNAFCVESKYKKISYFLRKMGAENITEITLKKLKLDDIEKCYDITEFDIAEVDGFGINKGEQIVREIQNTLKSSPEIFISALGISGISDVIAKSIVDSFSEITDDVYNIVNEIFNSDLDKLVSINGIGPISAQNFVSEIRKYLNLLEILYKKGLKWRNKNDEGTVNGKVFTLTGKGPYSRQEIQTMITNNGGIVKSISKNTNYLVAAEIDTSSSKAQKARKYGISIITYDELINMLKG